MALSTTDFVWIALIVIGLILVIIGIVLAFVRSGFPWYVWVLIIAGILIASISLILLLVF